MFVARVVIIAAVCGGRAFTAPVGQHRVSSKYVPKTHFSADNRAVFVAGLEGTGHHAVGSMIAAINKAVAGGSAELLRASTHRHVEVIPEAVQAVMYRRGEKPSGLFLLGQDDDTQTLRAIAADRVSP